MSGRRKAKGKRVKTGDGVRILNKAANGEGSVYQQADGRWCATWWVAGEKRPRKATGKTKTEAVDRRTKRRTASGQDLGELSTVGPLAEWWLHNVHKNNVRASSWSKAAGRVRRIKETLGDRKVVDLDYRAVAEWQTKLAEELAPRTVRHHRQTLAQIVDEAVKLGVLVGNPVRAVTPLKVTDAQGVALEVEQARSLIAAARNHRLGAAVALLFLQGWRVSEVLGLAWEDIDLGAGTVQVRRASVYVDGHGQQLGPPKTEGVQVGEHWLMPTAAELLDQRRQIQDEERAAAPEWETHTYDGEAVNLVFTTPTGGLVLRQTIAKIVKSAAKTAGLPETLSTHTGRRTVVTSLFVEGGESLEDIARYVGHAKQATTAGYVKRLGQRPETVARRAADVLDGQDEDDEEDEENGSVAPSVAPDTGPDQDVS